MARFSSANSDDELFRYTFVCGAHIIESHHNMRCCDCINSSSQQMWLRDSEIIIIHRHSTIDKKKNRKWKDSQKSLVSIHISLVVGCRSRTQNFISCIERLVEQFVACVVVVAFGNNRMEKCTSVRCESVANNIQHFRSRWLVEFSFRCAWTPSVLPRTMHQYRSHIYFCFVSLLKFYL